MFQFVLTVFCVTLLTAPAVAASLPEPFSATYEVSYRGFAVGQLHFSLRREGAESYVYEARADPNLLTRLLVGGNAVERSVMRIDARGVQPLVWFSEDGKSGGRRDGSLQFDWEAGRVTGTVEGQPVALPTEPDLQDRFSFQVAVMTALLRGREPGTIPMIDRDKVKYFQVVRAGAERIRTPAGEFDTVLYVATRQGSNRVSRVWHAPALGFIQVRAEQLRKGKVETVTELVRVERSKPGPGGREGADRSP